MSQTLAEKNSLLRKAVNARLAGQVETDSLRPITEPMPFATSYEFPYKPATDDGYDPEKLEDAEDKLAQFYRDEFAAFSRQLGDGITHEQRPGSLPFLELLEELRQLHFQKTAQYGGNTDPFENVTASAKCGVEPWRRALCDLSDCVVRMQRFANGQPVDYENALIDAANWSLICLLKLREDKRG